MNTKNKPILLIGASGNMGRRYAAIMNYDGIKFVGVDVGDRWPSKKLWDKAIVATPTDTHFKICLKLAKLGKTFLCEKPLSKNPKEIEQLIKMKANGYMVCNWSLLEFQKTLYKPGSHEIEYDYYNTGKDGFWWDLIQPIYLDNGMGFFFGCNPIFSTAIDDTEYTQVNFDKSYCTMIDLFYHNNFKYLWNLQDALAATNKVLKKIEEAK